MIVLDESFDECLLYTLRSCLIPYISICLTHKNDNNAASRLLISI